MQPPTHNPSAIRSLVLLNFLPRWLRRIIRSILGAAMLLYLCLFVVIGNHAHNLLTQPTKQKADAALILGSRAYLDGAPSPCMTGRVDAGIALAQQNLVAQLVMTGGLNKEDSHIEAQEMAAYAKSKGFQGTILVEPRSHSTLENLRYSRPILQAAGIKSIIIVSEPYHLWRAEKLVEAGHLGHDFNVHYAAAPSQCWVKWGMLFKGSLREPVAVMYNYAKGYL